MSIEKLRKPERLDEDKLQALRDLFPSIFTEGDRIAFERLKDELAANVDELEPGEEHYGLNWPGKRRAKKLATMPPTGTLKPVPGEGVNEETTRNVLIEGDNLEVLRILQTA
jgi:adenine-specific DNA-methyltransferase